MAFSGRKSSLCDTRRNPFGHVTPPRDCVHPAVDNCTVSVCVVPRNGISSSLSPHPPAWALGPLWLSLISEEAPFVPLTAKTSPQSQWRGAVRSPRITVPCSSRRKTGETVAAAAADRTTFCSVCILGGSVLCSLHLLLRLRVADGGIGTGTAVGIGDWVAGRRRVRQTVSGAADAGRERQDQWTPIALRKKVRGPRSTGHWPLGDREALTTNSLLYVVRSYTGLTNVGVCTTLFTCPCTSIGSPTQKRGAKGIRRPPKSCACKKIASSQKFAKLKWFAAAVDQHFAAL